MKVTRRALFCPLMVAAATTLGMGVLGCGKSSGPLAETAGPPRAQMAAGSAGGMAADMAYQEVAAAPAVARAASVPMGSAPDAGTQAPAYVEPKIIYTGQVALEVDDIKTAERAVRSLIEDNGGYISGSSVTYAEGAGAGGTLTARVPSENYPAVYEKLCDGTCGHLITGRESTQDVTQEWVDTEVRIRVLSEQRDQLRELMKRRGQLSEILEIERQIMDLQLQIEQAQGRLNVLKHQVALSTITIELRLRAEESSLLKAQREAGKWDPAGVFSRAKAGMALAWQRIATALIVFLTYTPCWLPVLLVLWLLWRRVRRFSRRSPWQPPLAPRAGPDGQA